MLGTLLLVVVLSTVISVLVVQSMRISSRVAGFIKSRNEEGECCVCLYPIPKEDLMYINAYGIEGMACPSCIMGIIALGTLAEAIGIEEADTLVSRRIGAMQILCGSVGIEEDGATVEGHKQKDNTL